MKLINLLLIALSAASSSATASTDENNNKAALLRGTFNSAFNLIMSSGANPTCIAPGNHCDPDANAAADRCCSGQAAGGGSYSCNCKAESHGSDAGPREAHVQSCTCTGNDDEVEEEKKDVVMATLSCAHGTGSGQRGDSCGTDDQCASCCCYHSNGDGNTCQPTGWCNGFIDEEEDTAVEEEEEEDFAASSLSCVAKHNVCNPNAAYGSAAACCPGPHDSCNCKTVYGSDAGPQDPGHEVCKCEASGEEEEFPFVAAATN